MGVCLLTALNAFTLKFQPRYVLHLLPFFSVLLVQGLWIGLRRLRGGQVLMGWGVLSLAMALLTASEEPTPLSGYVRYGKGFKEDVGLGYSAPAAANWLAARMGPQDTVLDCAAVSLWTLRPDDERFGNPFSSASTLRMGACRQALKRPTKGWMVASRNSSYSHADVIDPHQIPQDWKLVALFNQWGQPQEVGRPPGPNDLGIWKVEPPETGPAPNAPPSLPEPIASTAPP